MKSEPELNLGKWRGAEVREGRDDGNKVEWAVNVGEEEGSSGRRGMKREWMRPCEVQEVDEW